MLLKQLLSNVETSDIFGNKDISINNLKCNSKDIERGDLFFCFSGWNNNGEDYVIEAVNRGAVCVVSEKALDIKVTNVVVKDCRLAMSLISANFYGNPANKMKMVAVVGTNGKTTTSYLIQHILNSCSIKTGIIGTLGYEYNSIKKETGFTTPDPIELQKILKEMYLAGIKVVVMEVSAHAIYLKKVGGITYDVAVFTNLSQDHLDFFKTMEKYKNVKKSFFGNNIKYAVVNIDDDLGKEIANEFENVITYGIFNPSDVFVLDIKNTENGSKFIMNLFDSVYNVKTRLAGTFNIYNIMAASTCTAVLGARTNLIIDAIEEKKCVEGRLELVADHNGGKVIVDYAHTPDGLLNVLKTLKEICKNRLIVIFGCGGNRDIGKRKIMGEIACKYADYSIITSDNPRYEEPVSIIHEIEKGFSDNNYIIIENRKDAIVYGLEHLNKGDILLIAGKGAEKYQEILGIKHDFSDKKAVKDYINGL